MTTDAVPSPLFTVARTNTILYCTQWPATVAFYRDQLRLPVTLATDWFMEFQVSDHAYLSVADSTRATIPPGHGAGLTLSWQVTQLALLQQQLTDLGIVTTPLKKKWGAQVLYLHDPEGNRLELWEPL